MTSVRRFFPILVLTIINNTPILASSPALSTYSSECYEELGLRYIEAIDANDLIYNITCVAKCIYEKEGKLDPQGNVIINQFPSELRLTVEECLNVITATDSCKKANVLQTCITRKTDHYWKQFKSCDHLITYDDNFDDMKTYCYHRCQLIIEGALHENGSVNFEYMQMFKQDLIDEDQIIENCSSLITDEDECIRDLNTFSCVRYLLQVTSPEMLQIELDCAVENNRYPFEAVNNLDNPRVCYDRCILIKTGDLNENDIITSQYFKNLYPNLTHLQEAFDTCNITMTETDKCTEDLYYYDCIEHTRNEHPLHLERQIDCALETNAPLLNYRQQYKEYYCKNRCLMIKEGQLDSNGEINRTHLKKFTYNETIIDDAISECSTKNENSTCAKDINAYYCASAQITQNVYKLCQAEYIRDQAFDGYSYCYSRCLYMHTGLLTPEGEITVDAFKNSGRNVTIIENAINNCRSQIVGEHECERIMSHYNCINLEVYTVTIKDDDDGIH